MPPRTRASAKPDQSLDLVEHEEDAYNGDETVPDAEDDFLDIDDLDLLQLPDLSDTQAATQEPNDTFSWSESVISATAVSSHKKGTASQDLWPTDDDQDVMLPPLSSPQAENSQLPETMPLSSHQLQGLPLVDLSETASTTRRSSPFSLGDVFKGLWDVEAEDEAIEQAGDITNGKQGTTIEIPDSADLLHFPDDELYDATPMKVPAVTSKQLSEDVNANQSVLSSEFAVNSSVSKNSSRAKSTRRTYGSKRPMTARKTRSKTKDQSKTNTEPEIAAQPKTTKAKSAALTNKKSKQRAKSPLKFDDETQKIKSPANPKSAKPRPKPAPKRKPRQVKAAPRKTKASVPNNAVESPEPSPSKHHDVSTATMVTRSRKPHVPKSPTQEPTPVMHQDENGMGMINSSPHSPPKALQPIVLSSGEEDGDSGNESMVSASQAASPINLSPAAQIPSEERDSEKTAVEELRTLRINDSTTHKSAICPKGLTTVGITYAKNADVPAALRRPLLARTLTDGEASASRRALNLKGNRAPARRVSDRVIGINDRGSPIPQPVAPMESQRPKAQESTPKQQTKVRRERTSVYSSPLFNTGTDEFNRLPLSEARSFPHVDGQKKKDLVTGAKFRMSRYNTPEPLYKRITGKRRSNMVHSNNDVDIAKEMPHQRRHTSQVEEETRRIQDTEKAGKHLSSEIELVSKDMISYLSSKENGVRNIAKAYEYNGTRCVNKLVGRYEAEKDTLASECQKDCDNFVQQLDKARGAIEGSRAQRRLAMDDITNRYKRRRTESEREVWNAQRLNANAETRTELAEEDTMD